MLKFFTAILLLAGFCSLSGAEIFVGPGQKYTTVTDGVKALKNGDTLTILPGRYYEAVFDARKLKNVTIRAQVPGSVLIHGDKPAPKFKLVPGYRFVYAADWKDDVTAVNERENFKIYFPAASVDFLEFNFGYWFKKDGKLYISTTDGKAPETHDLTVSVLKGHGMKIVGAENCVIDGINFTGFYSHFRTDAWSGINGVQFGSPVKCVIRNCAAFFNANGITLSSGSDSTIENCVAFANGSQSPSSGGNIIGWSGIRNTIANCLSMYKIYTGGSQGPIGIRFYGIMKDCRILNCRSFGEDGINIKGTTTGCYAENNYCERHINVKDSRNNLFQHTNGYNPSNTSRLKTIPKKEWAKHFADPENHDFRDLSAVRIGMPAAVKKGDSVLLPAREYAPVAILSDDVTLRTYGAGKRAVLKGGKISGNKITLDNLVISAPLTISGSDITVSNCEINAKVTFAGKNVKVIHNAFKVQPDFGRSTGFHHSNTGLTARGTMSDLEGKVTFDGFPAGPNRVVRRPVKSSVEGPFIRSVTDSVVNIEWWTSVANATSELRWGTTPKCENKAGQPFSGGNWHSVSITGLKPGTKYYFTVTSRTPTRTHHSNEELAELDLRMKRATLKSKVMDFTTASVKKAPRTLRVKGKVIAPTLNQALPGDTVLIPGGVYNETLYIRSANVTLRNVPGEEVVIDGQRTLDSGIIIENKPGTVIDGITFKNLVGGGGAGVVINGGSDITVRRCFYDGRSSSYTPNFVHANSVKNLVVEHSFITRGFHGADFYRCPNLVIRNCVWIDNQINHIYFHQMPEDKTTFTRNVVGDNIPGKVFNSLINVLHLEAFNEKDNCFFLRIPESKRLICAYTYRNRKKEDGKCTYAEFVKVTKTRPTALFTSPGFARFPKLLKFTSPVFKAPGPMPATETYKDEIQKLNGIFSKEELEATKTGYKDWNFNGFFATNPECVKKQIGPDPKLFTNGVAN